MASRSGQAILLCGFLLFFLISGAASPVSVEVTPEKVVEPGALVTHVFRVINQGPDDDVYKLSLDLPEDWVSIPVPEAVAVEAGKTGYVFVNVQVPRTAEAGLYELTLTVQSTADPAVGASASALVRVQPWWSFELAWERKPPRVQPGKRVTAFLKVKNTGNVPDSYRVQVMMSPPWEAGVSREEFSLLPDEEHLVELYFAPPATAAPGTQYALTVTVSSVAKPTLTHSLSLTGKLAPPPPELVGGTLFPEWTMSTAFSMDEEADPTLRLRGWGSIPSLGYISTGLTVSMAGFDEAMAELVTNGWSVYLDGGTISGAYLGISGSPLFGGRIDRWGSWRLLFTEKKKGASALLMNGTTSLRLVTASDTEQGLGFSELVLRHDFPGPFLGWGLVSQAAQEASGVIFGLGGELVLEELEASGSWFSVGEGYPNQAARVEGSVDASYHGCGLPFDVSWSFVRSQATPPGGFHVTDHTLRVSTWLPQVPLLPRLALRFGLSQSDDIPASTNQRTYGLSAALRGDSPFQWALRGELQLVEDLASGTYTSSQTVSVETSLPLGDFILSQGFSVSLLSGAAGVTTGSEFSLVLDAPALFGSPELTLSGGDGKATLKVELEGTLYPDTTLRWVWEHSVGEEYAWSTQLFAEFPSIFPFCGPVKGRIRGWVFMDANANLAFDPGEEGVEGITVRADGAEAITGTGGRFAFFPMEPGGYRLTLSGLPPGLTPALPEPIQVELVAGEEQEVLVPLRPQSWLKCIVFNDEDQDGVKGEDERGIPKVLVVVRGPEVEEELSTDANGQVVLEVVPGTYQVAVDPQTLPEGFQLTTPAELEVSAPEYGATEVGFGAYRKPRPVVVTFGPPMAAFEYTPEQPRAGEPVHFTGAPSQAFGAEIVSYEWKFTLNEISIVASGKEVTLAFPQPGDWEVMLLVKDSNGLPAATRRTIRVQ